MPMADRKHLFAETLNGVTFNDETNSMGPQNSLCDDLENLLPPTHAKASFKGIQ